MRQSMNEEEMTKVCQDAIDGNSADLEEFEKLIKYKIKNQEMGTTGDCPLCLLYHTFNIGYKDEKESCTTCPYVTMEPPHNKGGTFNCVTIARTFLSETKYQATRQNDYTKMLVIFNKLMEEQGVTP